MIMQYKPTSKKKEDQENLVWWNKGDNRETVEPRQTKMKGSLRKWKVMLQSKNHRQIDVIQMSESTWLLARFILCHILFSYKAGKRYGHFGQHEIFLSHKQRENIQGKKRQKKK